MSRDASQISSDCRLWLSEPVPELRSTARPALPSVPLRGQAHALVACRARWRQRSCPTCKAGLGEPCRTPSVLVLEPTGESPFEGEDLGAMHKPVDHRREANPAIVSQNTETRK